MVAGNGSMEWKLFNEGRSCFALQPDGFLFLIFRSEVIRATQPGRPLFLFCRVPGDEMRDSHKALENAGECPKCRTEAVNACVGISVGAGELLRLWGMMRAEVATVLRHHERRSAPCGAEK